MMKSLLRGSLRITLKPLFSPRVPVAAQRRLLAPVSATQPRARGCSFDAVNMNGVPGRRLCQPEHGSQAVLYLHGGAYVVGSPGSHRGLLSHLATSANATVYAPDYRLAPEHVYPAALNDALDAYKWLLDQGYKSSQIFLAGDSAGGGLALCTSIAIRDRNLPAPAGLMLISPWADLRMVSQSVKDNRRIDPLLGPDWGRWSGKLYAGRLATDDPLVSPLFAALNDLPPTLIQVGTDEILLDDSRMLADKLEAASSPVQLHVYDRMWHVFQLHTRLLAESMQAIEEMADFMKEPPTNEHA